MSLESALDVLNSEAEMIAAWKANCQDILIGAQNTISYNSNQPSHDTLQKEINVYTQCMTLAQYVLDAIVNVNVAAENLLRVGYNAYPEILAPPAAIDDLNLDHDKNAKARAQIVLDDSARSVTDLGISGEKPLP
jgi:hypothetical protein